MDIIIILNWMESRAIFRDAGHIMGSAITVMEFNDNGRNYLSVIPVIWDVPICPLSVIRL